MESWPEGLASWDPWLWDMIVAVCCQSHNSCGILSLFAYHTSSKKYFLIILILLPYSPQSLFLCGCVLICPSRFEQEEFSDISTVFSKVANLAASCPHLRITVSGRGIFWYSFSGHSYNTLSSNTRVFPHFSDTKIFYQLLHCHWWPQMYVLFRQTTRYVLLPETFNNT